MTRMVRQHTIVHTVVYYYDANGEPTWAIGTQGADDGGRLPYRSVGEGVEIDMLHVHGFCRTCEPQATPTTPAGGRWLREDIGIRLLSSPHPNMSK